MKSIANKIRKETLKYFDEIAVRFVVVVSSDALCRCVCVNYLLDFK